MAIKFEKYSRSKVCPNSAFQYNDFHWKDRKNGQNKHQYFIILGEKMVNIPVLGIYLVKWGLIRP